MFPPQYALFANAAKFTRDATAYAELSKVTFIEQFADVLDPPFAAAKNLKPMYQTPVAGNVNMLVATVIAEPIDPAPVVSASSQIADPDPGSSISCPVVGLAVSLHVLAFLIPV